MPFFNGLRDQAPVVRLQRRDVVAVTGYAEALQVYADTDNFSSVNAITGPPPELPFTPQGDDIGEQIEAHRASMPFALELAAIDAPDHGRLRSLLMTLFTPGKLKRLEERFRATADQLIDEFIDSGRVEYIDQFANPMATLIITDLLGIPEEDRQGFRKYFGGAPAGAIGFSDEERDHNPLIEMAHKIAGYIAMRRAQPREDLLNEFASAKFSDGTTPTIEEATRLACFLFGAGQDTTAKLLGSSLRIMAEAPQWQSFLRDNPNRIPDFVEEALRMQGSIKTTHRLCKRTTVLAGVEIPAGTTVMIANMAANRDAARFPNPDTFDIDRSNRKQHLAFGRGAHTCAGAPLARAETRISLERLLDRVENLRLNPEHQGEPGARRFRYEPTYIMRGLEELHLEFDLRR